jgi:hypothetical protein
MPGNPPGRIYTACKKLNTAVGDLHHTTVEQHVAGMQKVNMAVPTRHDRDSSVRTSDHALHDQF